MTLEDALTKARVTLASGLVVNEAGVQTSVIRPILRELGWTTLILSNGKWSTKSTTVASTRLCSMKRVRRLSLSKPRGRAISA